MRPRLLVLLVAAAFLLSGCRFNGAYDLPLPGGVVGDDNSYTVTADFTDVLNVVPRTVVMANDVPVGQVTDVQRVGWHARVTMEIRKDINLPRDAEVDIRQTSLLGEKYIALLEPPGGDKGGPRLADGDHIPLARSGRNPEVEEVLGALSFLLSGGGVGQLHTITVELNKMMDGRTDDIRHLLGQVNDLVGTLDQQKSNIIGAMASVNRLARTLVRERRTIGSALDAMGPALKVLNRQHRDLMRMLTALDRLGVVGKRVLGASKDNIVASLRHLQPTLTKLADAGNSLPRGLLMMASFPFPKEAANIAMGDYANALFKMDIDLNKLLNGDGHGGNGLPNLIEVCSATPGKPVCQTLSKSALRTLCKLAPQSQLCQPNSGSGGVLGTLGGVLGGGRSSSSQQQPGGVLGGLLGGGP
ncbi:MAG TPA: MCE family protein [Marmoricola sp.]|nr:MCE family protein [Marmoricola sp.]